MSLCKPDFSSITLDELDELEITDKWCSDSIDTEKWDIRWYVLRWYIFKAD
jgi:hypothetical protein